MPAEVGEDWEAGTLDPRREGFEQQAPPRWRPGYGRYERDFPLYRDARWEQELTPRILGPYAGSVTLQQAGPGRGLRTVTRRGVSDLELERSRVIGGNANLEGGGERGQGGAPGGAVFLPFADRMGGLVQVQLRGLAQLARRPMSRAEHLSTDIFRARPEVLAVLGGESYVSRPFRKRLLEHPAPTPAGSGLAWMGWLPVDGAVVRNRRDVPEFLTDPTPRLEINLPDDFDVLIDDRYPESYFEERALDYARGRAALKRQAGQEGDIRLLSDARRGKLDWPRESDARLLLAQRLREAEARQWLIANSDNPYFPDYRPSDVARLNLENLWIIENHGIKHQAGPVPEALNAKLKLAQAAADEPADPRSARGAFRGGYRIQSLVPSAEAVRFNASAGVPIAVPPYLEVSPRSRVRLETQWVGWAWDAAP